MEEKTNTRSGGSRSDELDDFGFGNLEWLALHSSVPLQPLEVLTNKLVEEVEEQTGRPPERIPDVRALRTGLRRRSTDKPVEGEAEEPSSAGPRSSPPPQAEPAPRRRRSRPRPRPLADRSSPQPPLGDPPPPPTSPPSSLVGIGPRAVDDDPPQPESSDTEGATTDREPESNTGRGSEAPSDRESEAPTGRESGAPTEEDLGGSPPGREVPPPDGGGSTPPAQPVNPEQAAIEAEWDASGIPIAPKAKEYAGEEGIRPGETPPGRGLEVNGVNKITKRDVRDAVGERNRKKRKEEKEKAQARALQPNREASEEAEPSEPSGEAAEPETAPRSDEEAGEAGGEAPIDEAAALEPSALSDGDDGDLPSSEVEPEEAEPSEPSGEAEEPETAPRSDEEAGEAGGEAPIEAEESEAAALEPSALRDGDDGDLQRSEVEPGADSRPPYMGLLEEEPEPDS